MTLHIPVPESPSHDKPHLTPDIHFRLRMDLEHSRFLKLEHFLPCWRFRPRWPCKHVHTETAGTFCSDPTAPRQKNKPRRQSCEVWVPFIDGSLHTLAFSPRPFLQSAGTAPRRAVSPEQSQERRTHVPGRHAQPTGCNPSRWNSAGHWRPRWGWRGSLPRTHISVQASSPTSQVHLSSGAPGGSKSSPPTCTGQILPSMPCAHTCFRRPQRESALW